jgi:hypothetical protein
MAASKPSDERASALNYMGDMSKDMPAPHGHSKASRAKSPTPSKG